MWIELFLSLCELIQIQASSFGKMALQCLLLCHKYSYSVKRSTEWIRLFLLVSLSMKKTDESNIEITIFHFKKTVERFLPT